MSNFQLPKVSVFDTNGDPVSGAKIYFYATGTSTPLDTYTTEARTVANANPVICDSAGRAGPIWLKTDSVYKVVVKDASDATLYTTDPVKALGVVNTSAGDILSNVASNPLDYGALGDGVANEVTAVQAAINAATGTIDLLGKTYRCDSGLTITAGKRLINGTLDFSSATTTNLISVSGGSLGSALLLGANATVGDTQITLASTASLAAGDYVTIQDNQDWYTDVTQGETLRIKSIDSSNLLTFTSALSGTYTTAQSASVKKLTLASNIVIQDVRIICAYASTQRAIYAIYADRLMIDRVSVQGVNYAAVSFNTCINSKVVNCDFRKITNTVTGARGVEILNGSRWCSVTNTSVGDARHGIYVGGSVGVCREIIISGCALSGLRAFGVLFATATQRCIVNACTITMSSDASNIGIQDNGCDNCITGNTIYHPTTAGIYVSPQRSLSYTTGGGHTPASKLDTSSMRVTSNAIEFPGTVGIYAASDTSGQAISGMHISNNTINGAGSIGVQVHAQGFNISDVVCAGNIITNATTYGMYFLTASGKTISRANVSGNAISGSHTNDCIRLDGDDAASIIDVDVSGNTLSGGTYGVRLENASKTRVRGNDIASVSVNGIFLHLDTGSTASQGIVIAGNTLSSITSTGINISAASASLSDFVVSSNTLTSVGFDGIAISSGASKTLTRGTISNNLLGTIAATHYGITIAPTDGLSAININITGNSGTAGARLINVENGLYVVISDNNGSAQTGNTIACTTARNLTISGNIADTSGGDAILLTTCNKATLTANEVNAPTGRGIYLNTQTQGSVTGNVIHGTAGLTTGIEAVASTLLNIANNSIDTASNSGIYVNAQSTFITINGNTINSATGASIDVADSSNVTVNGNTIANAGSFGIHLRVTTSTSQSFWVVNGNNISSAGFDSIRLTASSTGNISNVVVSGNLCITAFSDSAGLYIGLASGRSLQNFAVTGNQLSGAWGVWATGEASSTLSNGIFSGNGVSGTIITNSSLATNNVAYVGNFIIGGSYAISENSSGANSVHVAVGNVATGQSTGVFNGTFNAAATTTTAADMPNWDA